MNRQLTSPQRTRGGGGAGRRRRWWLAAALAVAGAGRTGFGAAPEVVLTGITEPVHDVTLSASLSTTVSVNIEKVLVKEGDFVKEGQLIIQLDNKAEALDVERRKLLLDLLQLDLERLRKLIQHTTVSQADFDKKEAEYKIGDVEHRLAQEQLRKREIRSPIAGVVTELPMEAGEACQANQPLVRIVDARQCHLVCNVEPQSAKSLRLGQAVLLDIETGGGVVSCKGAISFISAVLDPASGLLKVKALFENPDGKARPGGAGRLRLADSSHGH